MVPGNGSGQTPGPESVARVSVLTAATAVLVRFVVVAARSVAVVLVATALVTVVVGTAAPV